jgi:hypothetical protein
LSQGSSAERTLPVASRALVFLTQTVMPAGSEPEAAARDRMRYLVSKDDHDRAFVRSVGDIVASILGTT